MVFGKLCGTNVFSSMSKNGAMLFPVAGRACTVLLLLEKDLTKIEARAARCTESVGQCGPCFWVTAANTVGEMCAE